MPRSLLKYGGVSDCERGGCDDEARRPSMSAGICKGGATTSARISDSSSCRKASSADFQSAVSQVFNLRKLRKESASCVPIWPPVFARPADCKSATQQIESLRYGHGSSFPRILVKNCGISNYERGGCDDEARRPGI